MGQPFDRVLQGHPDIYGDLRILTHFDPSRHIDTAVAEASKIWRDILNLARDPAMAMESCFDGLAEKQLTKVAAEIVHKALRMLHTDGKVLGFMNSRCHRAISL